jgi:hypothetical protein
VIGITKYRPTYFFHMVTLLNCSTQTYHPWHTSSFFFNNAALPIMRAAVYVRSIMCASTLLLLERKFSQMHNNSYSGKLPTLQTKLLAVQSPRYISL